MTSVDNPDASIMHFHPRKSLIGLLALKAAVNLASAEEPVCEEHFADLSHWEAVSFTDIDQSSTFVIVETEKDKSSLLVESGGSASGIIWKEPVDISKQPVIQWRWRVDQAPGGINHREKAGDDYALRIQVVFEYDPGLLNFGEKLEYETYRALHGRYPPHAALCYVWTPNEKQGEIYPCPYTDRVRIKVLRGQEATLGQWLEETVNVAEDYEAIFGEKPPARARIAIMADSDDSQSSTRALVDFIRWRTIEE
ncbi:MAG: DUF3047 domain-containing protein [Gammaproteobacteria bacterium]|nr:DUF3047 domain-containing protein [Gammaproteobacteria bacterium]